MRRGAPLAHLCERALEELKVAGVLGALFRFDDEVGFEGVLRLTVLVLEEDAETLNNLGFALYQRGNYRAAVDRLKRAAKLAPADERILNNLGLAYCRLGKIDEAYKAFARATGPVTGNLNTAKMLERFGREDDAIRYYEAARDLEPNNTMALRRLADLYNRVGRAADSQAARTALAIASNGTMLVTNGK